MNSEDVLVPATGNDGELEVIEISVSIGDEIETDDTIVVLESDKATVEVPCPKAGKVLDIKISVGDKVKEGMPLLKLTTQADEGDQSDRQSQEYKGGSGDQPEEHPVGKPSEQSPQKASKRICVPDLGGSEQVEVIEIVSSVGDTVEKDQTLFVLESDKATMEIPSPFAGKLSEISLKVGDKVSEGDLFAEIEVTTEEAADEAAKNTESNQEQQKVQEDTDAKNDIDTEAIIPKNSPTSLDHKISETSQANRAVHAGPAVRKFGREHGVDLARVKASGPKDRILIEDVTAYIKTQVQQTQSANTVSGGSVVANIVLPDFSKYGEVSVSSLSSIHLKTAENMQRSWSVPHVTQFDEADITDMEHFRKNQKAVADLRGIKLTPIAFLLKACAHALKALPQFNVALDLAQKQLIQKHFIHIGFAVDTPHGLFVPVIKDVDKKSIWDIATECQDLANRAKEKKLSPSEMQGGCFTVSSLGAIGGTNFTPIVNTPEVAILGVSKAQMKPVYVSKNDFEARLMLPLSLSYDHRAVNGADGARFTSLLSKVLGDLRELLL